MNEKCELCSFANPKATVTAIIIQDNKLLLLLRNKEPFNGMWDLPGGYMEEKETPEEAVKREIKEELGTDPIEITFIKTVPGYAYWQNKKFPILSHFYLVDITNGGKIKLDTNENFEFSWIPLKDLKIEIIAFDSNQVFCSWLKDNFTYDLERMRELIKQLDPLAEVKEQSLYKARINGHISKIYYIGKLIAMGWIFPRQTLLRKQAVIEDMIVDENFRGKGYGRLILLELLRWAKNRGIEVVELTTNSKRIAANELYKSEGFVLHPTNHYLYTVDGNLV